MALWERGALGALKSYKNNGAPLSVIKIVKYCVVWGGGALGGGGAKILQKIMAPSLFIIKIVTYCGIREEGGHWGRQNQSKDNGAPLSVIKIVK